MRTARNHLSLVFDDNQGRLNSIFERDGVAWDGTKYADTDRMRAYFIRSASPAVLIEGSRTNQFRNADINNTQDFSLPGETTVSLVGYGTIELTGDATATVTDGNPVTVDIAAGLNALVQPENLPHVTGAGDRMITGDGHPMVFQLRGVAQVEAGGFVTSFIPTEDEPVTRAAESLSVTRAVVTGSPVQFNLALVGRGGLGVTRTLLAVTEAEGTDGLHLIVNAAGNVVVNWVEAGATIHSIDCGPEPTGAYVLALAVTAGGSLTVTVDGTTTASGAIDWEPSRTFGTIHLGSHAGTNPASTRLHPGATRLGIPFIENRIPTESAQTARHKKWLTEIGGN